MEEETRLGATKRGKERFDREGRLGERKQDCKRKSREREREKEGWQRRERDRAR